MGPTLSCRGEEEEREREEEEGVIWHYFLFKHYSGASWASLAHFHPLPFPPRMQKHL